MTSRSPIIRHSQFRTRSRLKRRREIKTIIPISERCPALSTRPTTTNSKMVVTTAPETRFSNSKLDFSNSKLDFSNSKPAFSNLKFYFSNSNFRTRNSTFPTRNFTFLTLKSTLEKKPSKRRVLLEKQFRVRAGLWTNIAIIC